MKKMLLITIGLSLGLMADAGRFSRDDTTQIVIDTQTGLQWQDNADASSVQKKWTEAIDYCEALTLGGHDDWRLPNFHELYYIADRTKRNPAIDSAFQNVASRLYWSATTIVDSKAFAWGVHFGDGSDHWDPKSDSYHVRCVRAGQ